nr:MAG TPA: hypothetical protein [Caudoviricetes sp.]
MLYIRTPFFIIIFICHIISKAEDAAYIFGQCAPILFY